MVHFIPSQRGSALIIWLIITVLLTIMTTSFLEKILGLGQISGWITNSAQSYSLATWLIEEQLMDSNMTKQAPWNIATVHSGTSTSDTGLTLLAATGGTIIPMHLKWNSLFDSDWNIISMGDPVQIVIPDGIAWNNVDFRFRVPTISGATLTGALNIWSWVILWTFGYSGSSLYASGETDIFVWSMIDGSLHHIDTFNWLTMTWTLMTFSNFYTDAINGTGNRCTAAYHCTLKLSMIRPFLTIGWQVFPFLEYKIDFNGTTIPSQYMVIDSSAYNYGYIRSRQIRIPQITTSTATDFAVLE